MTNRQHLATALVVIAALTAGCSNHDSPGTVSAARTAPTTAQRTEAAATSKRGVFGLIQKPVCGPGKPATSQEQGLSGSAIKIGVMGDAKNTIVPGVNEDLYNASKSFVAWCNAAGGINGRKIEMTIRDAGITAARERTADACKADFALVGGGLALDGSAVATRVACGLVDFPGFVNDILARQSKFQVVATPSYRDRVDITRFRQIAAAYPDKIARFGTLLNSALKGSGRGQIAQTSDALSPLGFKYVYKGEFPGPPAVVDNWRPYVEEMRSADVKVLDLFTSPEIVAPLQQAMRDVGWFPDVVILPANNYSPKLLKGNDSIKNTFVGVYTAPFELADKNPAVKQFLDIMKATTPNWNHEELAVNSFSAWLLFAKAASACGDHLTRDCVVKEGLATTDWTAGGLTAPFTINTRATAAPVFCGAIVDATRDGFSLDAKLSNANNGIYNCSTKNSVRIRP